MMDQAGHNFSAWKKPGQKSKRAGAWTELTLGSCMAVPLLQHICCMGWCGREATSLDMPTLGSTVPTGLQNDPEPTSSRLGAPWLCGQWHHPLNGISP